jgi:hypothetical protein
MMGDPVESASPSQDAIGQFRKKGSIERGEMPVSLEGITEKIVRVAISLFNPIQEVEADRPWLFPSQNFPVLAISSSLAIRSSIGG